METDKAKFGFWNFSNGVFMGFLQQVRSIHSPKSIFVSFCLRHCNTIRPSQNPGISQPQLAPLQQRFARLFVVDDHKEESPARANLQGTVVVGLGKTGQPMASTNMVQKTKSDERVFAKPHIAQFSSLTTKPWSLQNLA